MNGDLQAMRDAIYGVRRARLLGCYAKEGMIFCHSSSSLLEEAFTEHAKPGH